MHNGFFTGSSQPCTGPRLSSLSYPVHIMQKYAVALINACQEDTGFWKRNSTSRHIRSMARWSCYLLFKRKVRGICVCVKFISAYRYGTLYFSHYNLRISQLSVKQPRHHSVLIDPSNNFSVCSWQDGFVLCDL